jgi:hypothetical protein
LAARDQWVTYKLEQRAGDEKPTKVPYNAQTRRKALANDSSTWSTYDQARAAYERGSYDGLGYELDWDDPYTCIDLDHCRDAETGELEEWARTIIAAFESYAEISPSGTGVHIWIRGRIPSLYLAENQQGRKEDSLEAYSGLHYLTITGQHLEGTPATIEDRQPALDTFCAEHFSPKGATVAPLPESRPRPLLSLGDDEVIADMCRYNARAAALWQGERSRKSESEDDEALIAYLWYWTDGDADQVERLMRASGLYRDKFDRADYLPRSIQSWIDDFPNAAKRSDWQPTTRGVVPSLPESAAPAQAASNLPQLAPTPPSGQDELAIARELRALREENQRLREALRIEHEARRMAETSLENLRREMAAARGREDEIIASDANDPDKVMLIALHRGMPFEKPDQDGYVDMWLDTTSKATGEKRGWANVIGRSSDVASTRLQRLAKQGAGDWIKGKYDPVTGKSAPPRFKPSPTLRISPVSILYPTPSEEGTEQQQQRARQWGGKRICEQCGSHQLETQVICKACQHVQTGKPVYADSAPEPIFTDSPQLAPTPPDALADAPPSVDIQEYRILPPDPLPSGRPCMKCGEPLRIFPAGGYYPCAACAAQVAALAVS